MTQSKKYIPRRSIKGIGNGLGIWGSLGFIAWLFAGALISRIFLSGDLTAQAIVFLFGFIWAIFGPFSLSFFLIELGGRALYKGDYHLARIIAKAGVSADKAILPLVNVVGIYDTPLAVLNLLNLASAQISLAQFEEATKNLESALDKSQATFGWENHLTQKVIGFLSFSYLYLCRFVQAESYFKKSVANESKILKEQVEEEAPEFQKIYTLSSLAMDKYGLAKIKECRFDLDGAEELYRDAIGLVVDNTEYDTDMLANLLNALGDILVAKGELDEAESLILRAQEIRKGVFPKDHPLLSSSYQSIGYLSLKRRNFEEARKFLERAMRIREECGLGNHPDGAETLRSLGELEFAELKMEQAKKLFEKSISVYEKTVGNDYPDLVKVLLAYSSFCSSQKDDEKAFQLKERSDAIIALYSSD